MSDLPPPPPPRLVTERTELAALCAGWCRQTTLAVDTEFVRTRTFFARLGLIQVGDAQGCYLLDCLALEDLRPFADLLASPTTVKVFHSPGEDLEVLHQVFGVVPSPLFDTQLAAAFSGLGPAVGYQRLVQDLFGVELPKGEQRSNWLRRPLAERQIRYAALDVAYLLPAHELLHERLVSLGRLPWAEEEFALLPEACLSRNTPQRVYQRLHRASLPVAGVAVLWSLVCWREEQARHLDLPRGFVLKDQTLFELARRRPTKVSELRAVPQLGAEERRRYGEHLLQLIRDAPAFAERSAPPEIASAGRSRGRVNELRDLVADVAREYDLPPELIAPRRMLEEAVRTFRRDGDPLPPELRGWREQILGRRLRQELGK